jgi:threonylcarbamoyladenosine tRNA methylthiotransferase MtaB
MRLRTFSITTLGCRVNHYESRQLATLLRERGMAEVSPDRAAAADVRIVHTCSVTVQAASKSRQSVRRMTRLPVLHAPHPRPTTAAALSSIPTGDQGTEESASRPPRPPRVVVTGCWATSDPGEAARLQGVDAVLGHHCDVGRELSRLLTQWESELTGTDGVPRSDTPTSLSQDTSAASSATALAGPPISSSSASPESMRNEGWMKEAGTPAGLIDQSVPIKPSHSVSVKRKLEEDEKESSSEVRISRRGMVTLPVLSDRQDGHQRAFLKVQDGCDAHCTYCIIPQLRPTLWSKPIEEAVQEARRLVDAGHREIVLTGIFLGAYGQATALRRRQGGQTAGPLGELIDSICTRVPELRCLRLSSMEPLDVTDELIRIMSAHPQVVPHFHLPLQSGSDALLRRMNRQYTRDDYLRMIGHLRSAFDRPALTTDIIVGFPGETDDEFQRTIDVVERVRFIHIHAFSYSPRPKTAAARWTKDFVRGPVVNERIDRLREIATHHSLEFRRQFVGEDVQVLVERKSGDEDESAPLAGHQHGRCERYFPVHFEGEHLEPGTPARVRIDRVTPTRTFGTLTGVER